MTVKITDHICKQIFSIIYHYYYHLDSTHQYRSLKLHPF